MKVESFDDLDYATLDGDWTDVTGTQYATDRYDYEMSEALLESELDAEAAREVYNMVHLQAVRVLRDQGYSVLRIAQVLNLSKTTVARLSAGKPYRRAPHPDIDRLVAKVWNTKSVIPRIRPAARHGDLPRDYSTRLNVMEA